MLRGDSAGGLLMSYGFRSFNDQKFVQIDDTYPVLQYVESGVCQANVDVWFSEAYSSDMPPWLFLRGGSGGYLFGVKFLGGPGAWTGFKLQGCSDIYHNHGLAGRGYGTWDYMVGKWSVKKSSENFGIRLWNGSGDLTFDSGTRVINLQFQFSNWSYQYRHSENYYLYYVHSLSLSPSASLASSKNYLFINPLMRERFNVPGGDGTSFRKVGPLTGETINHVTRSMYRDFNLPYVHPGIIGSPGE